MTVTTLHEVEGTLRQVDPDTLTIPEEEGNTGALDMVRRLVEGHEAVIRTARDLVKMAETGGDAATADLATARLEVHEKTAWMLRAMAS